MLTLLSFIAVILIVVGVHELGHYFAARACGVRVLLFSIGFGKPFWARRDKNDTVWALAPIPLGGYVQMFDADSPPRFNKYPDNERLSHCPHWKRIFIFAAGPLANFALAFLVLLVVLLAPERGAQPIIGEVRAGSPAAVAGVQTNETITRINGVQTRIWKHAELAMVDALLGGDTATIDTDNNRTYVLSVADVNVDGIADNGALSEVGIEEYTGYIKAEVMTVQASSPADAGGLRAGDAFVAVNGNVHDRWMSILQTVQASPNKPMTLVMWRASEEVAYTTTITLAAVRAGGERRGYLGVAPVYDRAEMARLLVTVQRSWGAWVADSARTTFADVARTIGFLQLLIAGRVSTDHLSGPIGIAVHSGTAAERGITTFLRFIALISTSLGVLNLLPLPVLDGGHICLSVLQLITRRGLPKWFLRQWSMAGVVILLMLTAWVVFMDLSRLLG